MIAIPDGCNVVDPTVVRLPAYQIQRHCCLATNDVQGEASFCHTEKNSEPFYCPNRLPGCATELIYCGPHEHKLR